MLYYLFDYLESHYQFPGATLFKYISFRASMTILISLLIGAIFGRRLINLLKSMQVKEKNRVLGLPGEDQKEGTPTMGGLIIIGSIVVPTLLFARLDNIYVILLLICTLWLGFIGFLDDYTKLVKKKRNWLVGDRGIKGRYKVFGQIGLGLIVGLVLYFNDSVKIRQYYNPQTQEYNLSVPQEGYQDQYKDVKSTAVTVPFFKNNELDYSKIIPFLPAKFTWVLYVFIAIFIITFVSNGANITDGVDGLAAGTSGIIAATLAIFAYVSGNAIFSQYLGIMYIPNSGELVIFCSALLGACIGFLWYNSYPAQVFMGDTGSLSLGGIIAVLALSVRKELLIPLLCGIFLAENLSVIIQVSYFKYTRKRFGEGKRVFLMAPLHHHFQKKGYHEAKIVTRFWVVGIFLAVLTLVMLKLR